MLGFIKAVSDTGLDTINAVYCDKPLIFTRAMSWEKLVSHYWAVSEVDFCLLMQSVDNTNTQHKNITDITQLM